MAKGNSSSQKKAAGKKLFGWGRAMTLTRVLQRLTACQMNNDEPTAQPQGSGAATLKQKSGVSKLGSADNVELDEASEDQSRNCSKTSSHDFPHVAKVAPKGQKKPKNTLEKVAVVTTEKAMLQKELTKPKLAPNEGLIFHLLKVQLAPRDTEPSTLQTINAQVQGEAHSQDQLIPQPPESVERKAGTSKRIWVSKMIMKLIVTFSLPPTMDVDSNPKSKGNVGTSKGGQGWAQGLGRGKGQKGKAPSTEITKANYSIRTLVGMGMLDNHTLDADRESVEAQQEVFTSYMKINLLNETAVEWKVNKINDHVVDKDQAMLLVSHLIGVRCNLDHNWLITSIKDVSAFKAIEGGITRCASKAQVMQTDGDNARDVMLNNPKALSTDLKLQYQKHGPLIEAKWAQWPGAIYWHTKLMANTSTMAKLCTRLASNKAHHQYVGRPRENFQMVVKDPSSASWLLSQEPAQVCQTQKIANNLGWGNQVNKGWIIWVVLWGDGDDEVSIEHVLMRLPQLYQSTKCLEALVLSINKSRSVGQPSTVHM
ncbi:hypothetical protein M407DRAFT_10193 [Tulasnella calospora MUT 4182]|uniref:Uncharacterized protein n=1 Tax=Tulasnella calospora MUT 4182 TaxID=1051891 RepID=A0A0C3QAK3_9AGAM|nr:hypothetical protein M407DRAFT_10193 [Tulasnella calospora MUT 4182]